jgi:hypothetical protein
MDPLTSILVHPVSTNAILQRSIESFDARRYHFIVVGEIMFRVVFFENP